MRPTRKMFQILVVRNNQTLPSRWFPNEQQAQFYCHEYNRIVDNEARAQEKAYYQPVEIPGRAAFAAN